jgi:hypothetical protein
VQDQRKSVEHHTKFRKMQTQFCWIPCKEHYKTTKLDLLSLEN